MTAIEQIRSSPLLTSDLRKIALKRIQNRNEWFKSPTLSIALAYGFKWDKTDEGYQFWNRVYNLTKEYENGCLQCEVF